MTTSDSVIALPGVWASGALAGLFFRFGNKCSLAVDVVRRGQSLALTFSIAQEQLIARLLVSCDVPKRK